MTRNLTIGIAGPFTGPRSAYGALLSTAVERAQPWFTPLWGDDQAQVAKAEAVARRFVASGVDAVVGHFNSDCARTAGTIYRAAGLPFLMPASTADDLLDSTAGIRICASDRMQIDALAHWLGQTGQHLASIWEDGSPYAARLSQAIRARKLCREDAPPDSPTAVLGAHHVVAQKIRRRGPKAGTVFVPDDCAIAEFGDMLDGVVANVICPMAQPKFDACVSLALDLLRDAATEPCPLIQALNRHASLSGRQYSRAGFVLQHSHYRQTECEGISP